MKFTLEGHPSELAATLIENPEVWFIIGEALRDDNQSLRTFAYRVKAGKHRGFQSQIPEGVTGTWETTVRSDGPGSLMYARWMPEAS